MDRKKAMQMIHIGKRQLGWDDDIYRDAMEKVTGKRSAKDLKEEEQYNFMVYMNQNGAKLKVPFLREDGKPAQKWFDDPQVGKMYRMIAAMLRERELPWNYAHAIAKNSFGVTRLEFLNYDQVHGVCGALFRNKWYRGRARTGTDRHGQ